MNSASEDIKDMLDGESSLGLTYGTDLFIGKEPSTPDNCVTIFDTSSFPPMRAVDPTVKYYYSSVQIRVRNKRYLDGYAVARNIFDSLHNRAQEMWNGTLYTVIQAAGEPALLDWDGNNRPRFIINFNMNRR